MRIITKVTIASAALLAAATPTLATPVEERPFTVEVEHDDLDLATRNGVARLDDRLRSHIRRLCANGGRDRASIELERECRAGALASAQPEKRIAIARAEERAVRLADARRKDGSES
jgi:UrcA family protein